MFGYVKLKKLIKLNICQKLRQKNRVLIKDHHFGLFFKGRELGKAIQYGPLKMIPVMGTDCPEGVFSPPVSSITFKSNSEYGRMSCHNLALRPSIYPLHMGFFRQDMQSHAGCSAHILQSGTELELTDACLVRDPLGNKQAGMQTHHFFLPYQLRHVALDLRGIQGYTKLWGPIARLNKQYGLDQSALLDALKSKYEKHILEIAKHFKKIEGQTGAIFYLDNALIGIELAPDAQFWSEIHHSLIAYGYGPLVLIPEEERKRELTNLQTEEFSKMKKLAFTVQHEESNGYNRQFVVECGGYLGQAVTHGMQPAYLSLFHKDIFQIR